MTDRTQHRRWVFLGARPSKSDMDKIECDQFDLQGEPMKKF